jgi:hypothetical protein
VVGLGAYTVLLQTRLSSDTTDVGDRLSTDLTGVEQKLSTEMESLQTETAALQSSIGDVAASQILGEWSRDVPQQQRIGNQFQGLLESVMEAESGAASQLNRDLVRTANIASLLWIAADMQEQSENRKLQILNQCLEYLLAINNATSSCNMQPIFPYESLILATSL